ncbi:hypothetical protein FRAHR75_170080 [Frankia sp. Hr75.2]|nr:hypothetical protein FRAHR75_170080 [Frankia sp. Hr75.2]
MKATAAVLRQADGPYVLEEVELDPPGPGDVLVRGERRHVPYRRRAAPGRGAGAAADHHRARGRRRGRGCRRGRGAGVGR